MTFLVFTHLRQKKQHLLRAAKNMSKIYLRGLVKKKIKSMHVSGSHMCLYVNNAQNTFEVTHKKLMMVAASEAAN